MSPANTRSASKGEARGMKTDIAYDRIRESILEGAYAPGERLVLDRIARELNVSTLPVREAIRRLEAEGFVEFKQNVGARVATVDAETYVQSVETLAVLDGAACRLSYDQLSVDQVQRIRALNAKMRTAMDCLDGREYAEAHDALHSVIFESCQNTHLVSMIADIRMRLRQVRMSGFGLGVSGGLQEIHDHDEFLRMVEADASSEEVEEFARAHIERSVGAFRGTSDE